MSAFELKKGVELPNLPKFPLDEFLHTMEPEERKTIMAVYVAKTVDYLQDTKEMNEQAFSSKRRSTGTESSYAIEANIKEPPRYSEVGETVPRCLSRDDTQPDGVRGATVSESESENIANSDVGSVEVYPKENKKKGYLTKKYTTNLF